MSLPSSTSGGKSLVIPMASLGILYICSIIFFHLVEGWNYLDAAYYTSATITTVGYGDFVPKTDLGKVGAIVLIFSGISLAFYIITRLGTIRERAIDPHVQQRLSILRNLVALQTDKVETNELKRIRKKINSDERPQDFGRL